MSEEDRIVNEILEKNGRIKLARKVYELENIIKEVREYLDKYSRYCSNKEYFSTRNPITDLKIILDKEVN